MIRQKSPDIKVSIGSYKTSKIGVLRPGEGAIIDSKIAQPTLNDTFRDPKKIKINK